MTTDEKYDVFVSYKHRQHSDQARKVVGALRQRGLQVWFDVEQLAQKEHGQIDKAKLGNALTAAVKSSSVSVVFAAQYEAVALPPGMTQEEALATGDCMTDENGALIAWNWQKLEIDNSRRFIEVHPDYCSLNTGGSSRRTFGTETEMLQEIERMVMQYLDDAQIETD